MAEVCSRNSSTPEIDAEFMRQALALARLGWGLTSPNPMVGALVVADRKVIGRGYHAGAGLPHAEVNALADALRRGHVCTGATLYVTLEPCSTTGRTPPCTELIKKSNLARVVIGSLDPNPLHAGRGVQILEEAGIEVRHGVEKAACDRLNEAFFKWIVSRKPFVLLKMAMTLDGRIATASGESKWITGETARGRVQQLRMWADALMVGGGTVRADRPSLTARRPDGTLFARQPRRLIASSSMSDEEVRRCFPDGETPEVVNPGDDPEKWRRLLERLGREEVTALLLEGGGELAGAALRAGAVDRVEFHIAPKILGGRNSRPVVGGADPAALAEALELDTPEIFRLGRDLALTSLVRKGEDAACLPES